MIPARSSMRYDALGCFNLCWRGWNCRSAAGRCWGWVWKNSGAAAG
jgi:hypothetical protein